jgi:Tol biopolymer transport system component
MKRSSLAILCFVFFPANELDLSNPPVTLELLGPGKISTGLSERDMAVAPDGNEIFYTLQAPEPGLFQTLVCLKKDGKGNWGEPFVPSFSGTFSDLEPAYSPDGKRLFFCSNRPVSGTLAKDFDIWVVDKMGDEWGEPVNLGPVVNTKGNEFYPSVAANGNLYFTATYKNGVGKEDIFLAEFENGGYTSPVALDSGINSTTYEFNAYVSPEEDLIIYSSYGRKGEKGGGDLYLSKKDNTGKWLPAKNIVTLNSEKLDYCPFLTANKKVLFFTSERHGLRSSYADKAADYEELLKAYNGILNGKGNIYWISFEEVIKSLKF